MRIIFKMRYYDSESDSNNCRGVIELSDVKCVNVYEQQQSGGVGGVIQTSIGGGSGMKRTFLLEVFVVD